MKNLKRIIAMWRFEEREEIISMRAMDTCASAERRYTLVRGEGGSGLVEALILGFVVVMS